MGLVFVPFLDVRYGHICLALHLVQPNEADFRESLKRMINDFNGHKAITREDFRL